MGCLAGPVVAAAVILHPDSAPPGIDDSKKLTARQRERLDARIRETAVAFAIGVADVEEIDRLNILRAAQLAMVRAIGALKVVPGVVLVDGRHAVPVDLPQQSVVRGDGISASIGAASIVAKVYRDRLMTELDSIYPGYGFAGHKGYGSEAHRRFLQQHGPTPIHRKSFSWTPV